MPKSVLDAVRAVCLSLPEAEEFVSHGAPNFRVRGGKSFASYVLNHHGDGRVALWVHSTRDAQSALVKSAPKHFFVPPYVGPSGWIGVNLDSGLAWRRIAETVHKAYTNVAPASLRERIGKPIVIAPPPRKLKPEEIDPLKSKYARGVLKEMRAICLALPEAGEDTQFGMPVWKAGKKTFAMAHAFNRPKLILSFWVGLEHQSFLTADKRFEIPAYMGHNGWIALDASKRVNWNEVRALTLESYRHFALKRMLGKLDA